MEDKPRGVRGPRARGLSATKPKVGDASTTIPSILSHFTALITWHHCLHIYISCQRPVKQPSQVFSLLSLPALVAYCFRQPFCFFPDCFWTRTIVTIHRELLLGTFSWLTLCNENLLKPNTMGVLTSNCGLGCSHTTVMYMSFQCTGGAHRGSFDVILDAVHVALPNP
jgi:nitrate/nitrite transporter NarK